MKRTQAVALALAIGFVFPYVAIAADDHATHHPTVDIKTSENTAPMSTGDVKKVEKSGKKIIIKHGPLENLDMPAMTMVFQVKNPKMLEQVKAGDKIRFVAEMIDGQVTVTRVEKAK